MNILILTKRQYAQQDIIDNKYGRFREIPLELARLGHQVRGLCLSYKNKSEGDFNDSDLVSWASLNAGPFKPLGFLKYFQAALEIAKEFKPDIIFTFSDSLYAIAGYHLSRKIKTKCIVDLYDNFETYASSKIPMVTPLFHKTLRSTDGITSYSRLLTEQIVKQHNPQGKLFLLESSIDPKVFRPQNKIECRKNLQLPKDSKIICYAGAINQNRGIDVLFKGFERLEEKYENIHLALAGAADEQTAIPEQNNIHHLGNVSTDKVAQLYCASDLGVICYKDDMFAKYSYPFKGKEMIACGLPILSTKVGNMEILLKDHIQCLFEPEDVDSFVSSACKQLDHPITIQIKDESWASIAEELTRFFEEIC